MHVATHQTGYCDANSVHLILLGTIMGAILTSHWLALHPNEPTAYYSYWCCTTAQHISPFLVSCNHCLHVLGVLATLCTTLVTTVHVTSCVYVYGV